MADVRALLAAERQARRISHPYLTYTKSGQLLCNVCNLNVKSESLWEGHLRSANHRQNAARSAEEKSPKSLKRKLDDVEESHEGSPILEDDARKKPKSRAVSHAEKEFSINGKEVSENTVPKQPKTVRFEVQESTEEPHPSGVPSAEPSEPESADLMKEQASVDNDEMAAFEREIASLEQPPDYSSATIIAAPISAAEIEEHNREERRRQQDLEAEDEIEEEGRKLEEEFEIMEGMEDRIKKLKERRDALRRGRTARADPEAVAAAAAANPSSSNAPEKPPEAEEGSDEDDVDDWYS